MTRSCIHDASDMRSPVRCSAEEALSAIRSYDNLYLCKDFQNLTYRRGPATHVSWLTGDRGDIAPYV